jgi:hypothetical protein
MGERALVVLLVGSVYLAAGLGFGALAGAAETSQLRVTWRLAAWVVSAIAFGAHIAYGHARARLSLSGTAFDAALAVALGAFGLAVSAFVHGIRVHHRFPVTMLVVWPLGTAIPAFVVALTAAFLLGQVPRRR